MSTTVLPQQPMSTRPPSLGNGPTLGPTEMTGYASIPPTESTSLRNLEDGAMVVMYAAPGELIIVRPNGKYWDLEPISTTEDNEELTLQFFPAVSIFTVVKKGRYVAFKSLAAEGRILQAVAADDSVALRVNNYNFGAWESWEAAGNGFVNRKWPQRSLGLEVREIQAVAVEDIRRLERHYLKMSKDKQKQIRTLEIKHQETKRQLQEQGRARKRMTMQHQRELEDSRSRLEEALRAKQRLEVDAVQIGARLKQKELQLQQLTLQRDTAESALEQKEANQRAHEKEIDILKEKHENDMDALKRQHRNEVEAMKRDRDHEMGRSTKHANGEVAMLQQKLEQAEEDKQREIRRLSVEYQHTIQQKINEISNLRDENQKLTIAMQTIRDQLQRGFVAINSSEMAPSRAGTERSLEIPHSAFRYSPAPSRASTGRRQDEHHDGAQYPYGAHTDSAITPRRGSLPCAPHSPYGRMSPVHSPEPFALRSSAEYRPRRGDSRLSDSAGLRATTTDEMPPPFRRPGSGFSRHHRHPDLINSRYSSHLDSVEDTITKEEFADDTSEHEEVQKTDQNEAGSDSEAIADETETPRDTVEENQDTKKTTPVSDDTSVDSAILPVEDVKVADPTDVLITTSEDESEASDISQSWGRAAAPIGNQSQSKLEAGSDKDSNLGDE